MTTTLQAFEVVTDPETGQPIEANTPAWLLARRSGLGASDAAAILGLARYTSPLDVYRDKTADTITDEQNEAMEFGHLMEPVVRSVFARRHGTPGVDRHRFIGELIPAPGLIRSLQHPHLLASLDGVIVEPGDTRAGLQIKNQSAWRRATWRDSEGGVPDEVRIQVTQEALVFGETDHGWAAALFDGNTMPEPMRIDVDPEFAEFYLAESERWWAEHVVAGVAPEPTLADDLATVWMVAPGEQGGVDLSDEALAALDRIKRLKRLNSRVEELLDEYTLRVKTELGEDTDGFDARDAAIGFDRKLVVTWRQNKPSALVRAIDEVQLRLDHPELGDLLDGYMRTLPGRKAARPFVVK